MSTADLRPARPAAAPARRPGAAGGARPWLRFLRSELRLIFGRWRNLALLAVLAGIPVLIGVALKLSGSGGGEVSAQIGGHAPEGVCRDLVMAGVPVAGFDTPRPSLEDLFVELTGEGFDVDG